MCIQNLRAVIKSLDRNLILVHSWSLLPVIHFTKKEPDYLSPFLLTPCFYVKECAAQRPSLFCDRTFINSIKESSSGRAASQTPSK